MRKAWYELLLGSVFVYVGVWVLTLVWRFALPRHDVLACVLGIGYALCMLSGAFIMANQVGRRLRKKD